MSRKLFITGTDTEVGKTYISVGILTAYNQIGHSTIGLKPVASGCHLLNNHLYSDDALALQSAASIKLEYEAINPYSFAPAIAPHIAAQQVNIHLTVTQLNKRMKTVLSHPADVCVVEGFGGWLAPLNNHESMADFVKSHALEVILVVGMRLGCLNHALLTMRAMQSDKIKIIGWIANCIDPEMAYLEENIATLKQQLTIPNVAIIKYACKPEIIIDVTQFPVDSVC